MYNRKATRATRWIEEGRGRWRCVELSECSEARGGRGGDKLYRWGCAPSAKVAIAAHAHARPSLFIAYRSILPWEQGETPPRQSFAAPQPRGPPPPSSLATHNRFLNKTEHLTDENRPVPKHYSTRYSYSTQLNSTRIPHFNQ